MGMFDTLRAQCPSCAELVEEQTKFRDDPLCEYFSVGQLLSGAPIHLYSVELNDCTCGAALFALLDGGRFLGFFDLAPAPVLYSDKARRQGIAAEIDTLIRTLKGNKKC